MTDITRDELVAIALSAGYIKVNIASGEVFATRGPGEWSEIHRFC